MCGYTLEERNTIETDINSLNKFVIGLKRLSIYEGVYDQYMGVLGTTMDRSSKYSK